MATQNNVRKSWEELKDYLLEKTGTINMQHGKSAPEKKIILPGITNEKFVRKLVFLHNHLMQYYAIPYEEVMIVYDKASFVMTDPTPLIYYEPTAKIVKSRIIHHVETPHLYNTYTILDKYLTTGLIAQVDMQYANTVWQWLKQKAGITTP